MSIKKWEKLENFSSQWLVKNCVGLAGNEKLFRMRVNEIIWSGKEHHWKHLKEIFFFHLQQINKITSYFFSSGTIFCRLGHFCLKLEMACKDHLSVGLLKDIFACLGYSCISVTCPKEI